MRMHGNEKRGSGYQFLVIEIAGVNPRRSAIHFARGWWRSDAHAAEERFERKLNARSEGPDFARSVQGNDLHPGTLEFIGQEAGASAKVVISVRNIHANFANTHLEHVTGLGAFDGDRAGQQMAAGSAVVLGDLLVYGPQLRWDLVRWHAGLLQTLRISGDGLDLDRIAGVNRQHRFRGRPIISPSDVLRGHFESEVSGQEQRADAKKKGDAREGA